MKTQTKTVLAIFLLPLLISCTKENISSPSSVTASKENAVTGAYYIGEHFGGGVIFYIDSTGKHGLIAATENQGYVSWWRGKATFDY